MLKTTVLSAAIAAALFNPLSASAADDKELAAIRAQIRDMKESYEARLQSLEQRLQDAQSAAAQAQNAALASRQAPPAAAAAPSALAAAAPAGKNAFNPSIALVLGGTYANLSRDPDQYRLQGFLPPAGEVGPGRRGFNLGESELTMSASIDPIFSGQLTFALSGEDEAEVEEAFVQARGLANGVNIKAGRFLSSIGYLNNKHAHTWDFVDAPLAYQAFLGGQYKPDGLQATWLAPTDTLVELGVEVGSGSSFPGNERNKNGIGAAAVYAHVGDDIGASGSWRAGLSLLRTGSAERQFDDIGSFTGSSRMLIADAIYKWAPNGNATQQNFKLQGEYFRRKETGDLSDGADTGSFNSTQSGWYLQGVYQFVPNWRAGLRYDRLTSGTPAIGLAGSFPLLDAFSPVRTSAMLDYSPSEFSRLRLQLARDRSRPGVTDNQIFLQYIMSLGAHAAHAF
ncbi:hypothetical protein CR105_10685 [Massilia eurypsychrophila]|jgi:hypothetical protein|uniref:Porin n=1 Tax=Massilia eurypsychrophila TaxID=1485217 RepID=A0A2G8TFW1_9BURK|nr:TonB-dependent receptor [Massilia eurypsychrophila]PIL44937.1 hypothetical protein CR105_10685 [Massilia eurypsychrophila]